MEIKHVFFDLDHTLWDFDRNSREALLSLFKEKNLEEFVNPYHFIKLYKKYNNQCWRLYEKNKIEKNDLRTKRFELLFEHLNIPYEELAPFFGENYIKTAPYKTGLIEGSIEVLDYLKDKYPLHIITNGFKEIQKIKLSNCGLEPYFQHFIYAEDSGAKKPNPLIFEYALKKVNVNPENAIYIGDHIRTDFQGAKNAGLHAIHFNPKIKKARSKFTITHLNDLKNFL